MKKRLILILAAAMAFGILLTGCKNGTAVDTATDYNIDDFIKVGEYKELPYYTPQVEVTDEDLQSEIDMILSYATETELVTEGVVEDGDTINVAFEGKIDGETFEGGSSESYDITVGTTSMIEGFVEGLIGKNIGETVTLDLKFPADYHATDLAGKDVVFTVTINNKRISTTPELTDEFVKKYYEYDTVEAFKEHLKEDILTSKVTSEESSIKNQLWTIILEESELLDHPASELEAAEAQILEIEEQYKTQAENYGMEWTDFLSAFYATDEAGFAEMMNEYRDNIIKNKMVSKYIAQKENITFSEKDYEEELNKILERNGLTEETFKSYYNQTIKEYADENGWRDEILSEKVMDKVKEMGKEVSKEEYDAYINEHYPAEELEENHDHDHEGEDHEHETEGEDTAATETEADAETSSKDGDN